MKKEFEFTFSFWRAWMALCLVVALTQLVFAQNRYGDPSARVARLNYIQGNVSFQPGGEDEWVWASQNRPLTTSDSVWTDGNSRAELHIGSTAIRVGPFTSFSFLNLDDDMVQIELNSGTLNLRVQNFNRDDIFEVDTPNVAFTLLRRGDYRITVDPDGSFTTVTVRDGQGQITGGGQAFLVDADSQVQVSGTDYITYDVYDLPERDTFDRWANTRDLQQSRSTSARYVSPELTGYEDLDGDGTWRTDRNLGPVWTPSRVSRDWAPYRDGHWAWVDPWGWTWVDNAPFGFVTSHYGRWTYFDEGNGNGAWAWVPPRRDQTVYQRPVYSPALVTFVSTSSQGSGYNNNVMWVPLAPGEVYVPSYRASTTYITQVNVTNTVVLQPVIARAVNNPAQIAPSANQRVVGAATAVPRATFINAQPVARAAVRVDPRALAAAPSAAVAPVAPVRASVVAGSAATAKPAAPPPQPPAVVVSRPVVAKVAPPPPPVAFERKREALAATPGKPLDPKVEQNLRAAAPAPAVPKPVVTAPPATVVKPAAEVPKKPQPATSPNVAKQEHPATPATGAPPPGQQRAEQARQQAAQQQAEKDKAQQVATQQQAAQGQQQAGQARQQAAQQQAAQQQAEKDKAQQQAAQAQQQAGQARQQAAQQQAAQQQAEKDKAQQQAAQQQAAQQQAAQQQAEKDKAQQQAAQGQQQAEQARQRAAQQQAQKDKAQQLAAQQQAEKDKAQQQAAQGQQQAEQARQQAAQQQAEKDKAQQLAAQQQADRARGRDRQQISQAEPPANPPGKQPNAGRPQPNAPAAAPMRVPENAQAAKLISQPKMNIPANAQNIHGVVRMRVLIGTDGKVKNASVLGGPQGGPPPLQALALENVRQRQYQPTMVNGTPVEVETEVSIRF